MLQHEDSLTWNGVLVFTDKVYQGIVWVLFRHCLCGIELAFHQADAVDGLVCNLLSAAVHDFGHARGCRVHQILPQRLVVNLQNNWNLFPQELKHDVSMIAET